MSSNDPAVSVEELEKRAAQVMPKYPEISFRSFLESTPPDTYVDVIDIAFTRGAPRQINAPDVTIYCDSESCQGFRLFRAAENLYPSSEWTFKFLKYVCRNCGSRSVTFALSYAAGESSTKGTFKKLGQTPPFGPRTP